MVEGIKTEALEMAAVQVEVEVELAVLPAQVEEAETMVEIFLKEVRLMR